MRGKGLWIDFKSPLPRESKTICSECKTENRYGYRKPYCGKCGSAMIGERKYTNISRFTKMYERGNFEDVGGKQLI